MTDTKKLRSKLEYVEKGMTEKDKETLKSLEEALKQWAAKPECPKKKPQVVFGKTEL